MTADTQLDMQFDPTVLFRVTGTALHVVINQRVGASPKQSRMIWRMRFFMRSSCELRSISMA